MNTLQAGFARVNVTPMMGIGITGYYKPRFVKGVRDELELSALALTCGQTRLVLLSMDHCGIHTPEADSIRAYVAEKTGLPVEAVYLHATHTHTGPCLVRDSADPSCAVRQTPRAMRWPTANRLEWATVSASRRTLPLSAVSG